MDETRETVRRCLEDGDFDIEWMWGAPKVHFWPGDPYGHVIKTIGLRELLLRDLETTVPLEFFGDPMAFSPPRGWVHAERIQLLQALISAYDKWEKRAVR